MSTVFSFRLNPSNPREARAMEVIRNQQQRGFSIRDILVETLLTHHRDIQNDEQIDSVNDRLDELIGLVQSIKGNVLINKEEGSLQNSPLSLSEQFLGAMKMAAQQGLQIEK